MTKRIRHSAEHIVKKLRDADDYGGTHNNLAIIRRGLVFDGHLFGVLTHARISPRCSLSRAIMDIDNSTLGSWILALGALLGCEQKR